MGESPFFHHVVLRAFYRAIEEKNARLMMVHAGKVKDYVIDHHIEYAKEKVLALFERGKEHILAEEEITYLKYETELLQFYGEVEYAVKIMCDCAYLFAQAGEFQSAYRILYDANSYAVSNQSFDAVIRTLVVQGEVCIYEGDYDTALAEMEKARRLLKEAGVDIPQHLDANIALIRYRKGNYGEAEKDYERILSACENKDSQWWGITFNQMLCRFRQQKAVDPMLQELKENLGLAGREERIEYHLAAAEILLPSDEEETVRHLAHAVELIGQAVNENVRLHYRRGVREKYLHRVKNVICRVKTPCRLQKEAVTVLVFLKMNMMTEWLALKEFVRRTKSLDRQGKEEADAIIKRMEGEGIPILYGFLEKYDDPFEEYGPNRERDTVNKMWNDLAALLAGNQITVEALYQSVSCKAVAEHILADGRGMYIFVECCEEGLAVWFPSGTLEVKRLWGPDYLLQYLKTSELFRMHEASRSEFRKQLEADRAMLKQVFDPVFEIIERSDQIKLHMLTDFLSADIPFLSLFLDREAVKTMIREGRFAFALNPILYAGEERQAEEIRIDFVEYKEENLSFQDAEFEAVASKFQTGRCCFEQWAGRAVHEETVIHISSHGMPIDRYTDPVFAKLRGEKRDANISIPAIQKIACRSDYRLVCINCCYGGVSSNRNHFKVFRTSELIGYHTAFMLNGKAAVIAPKWQVMDLVAVFFAELLYQKLEQEKDFAKGYIKAVNELYWLGIEESRKIAAKIPQAAIREKALSMLHGCPVSYPFQNMVDVGAYQYFELL